MSVIRRIDELPRGGNCTGKDPSLWFPLADRSVPGLFAENYRRAIENTRQAKEICSECSIKFDCLSYALYHEIFGIWGGTTEREREKLRKKMNISVVQKEQPSRIAISQRPAHKD